MADGRLLCIYTKRPLLLVMLLCGVVTSQTHIDKLVGEKVVFPSGKTKSCCKNLKWKYQNEIIARYSLTDDKIEDFQNLNERFNLSRSDYNLELRNLTLQDKGIFQVVSENTDGSQRPTETYYLDVHVKEPIFINHSVTWHANGSCSVFLECNTQGYSKVSYNWTIEGQKYIGAQIHFLLQPPGADTNVTCITYNSLSNGSASKTVKCTQVSTGLMWYFYYVEVPLRGTVALVLIIAAIAVCRIHRNHADIGDNQTIYANNN